ncbi:MAG: hypothetical protein ABIG29_00165 [Candidatus Nealsonbacteria bacterium]
MLQTQVGNKKGISTIEILLAVSILGVTLISFFSLIGFSLKVAGLVDQTTRANALAQETMEAVRDFRDQTSWLSDGLGVLSVDIPYYPEKTGTVPPRWDLVSGQGTVDIFTRQVIFEEVYRDASDNIVAAGAEDPETKKVKVTVSWQERGNVHQVELVNYFTNWQE